MNYFDEPTEEEVFTDQPDEVVEGQQAPPAEVKVTRPAPAPKVQEPEDDDTDDSDDVTDEEEGDSEVLTDARLRLEMGKLYELIMKHDLFEGVESDPKAMKTVQKEIRAYAQERMEIMLGMRQEQAKEVANAFPMELFPFNSMEVEVLKALAATATKGESRDAEPLDLGPQPPPARKTLNPIGKGSGQTRPVAKPVIKKPLNARPKAPVDRSKANAKIQRILEEEGLTMDDINEVFDPNHEPLDRKKLSKMTEDQIIARNRQISLRNKRADNPAAAPMPSPEQLAQTYEQRSLTVEAQNPKWRQLIEAAKAMPPSLPMKIEE